MLHALAAEPSARPVWWIHGARNRDEHAFGPEVDGLLAALPQRRTALVAYSRPPPASVPPGFDLRTPRRGGPRRTDPPPDADYYLCGPDAFMRDVGAALTARGVAPERVRTEAFGAVPAYASGIVKTGAARRIRPPGRRAPGPTVTFVAQQPRRRRGTTATPASSTSPRRATSRPASAAARACATTARAACSTARRRTASSRSSPRPRGASCSAARGRPPRSRWTSEPARAQSRRDSQLNPRTAKIVPKTPQASDDREVAERCRPASRR